MPLTSLPLEMRLFARCVLVFFDDKQQNNTLKRIALINEKENKALIIDSFEYIGIINVVGNKDGYGNTLWAPRDRIGLLRRLSSEKLTESDLRISDKKLIDTITTICGAEKSNGNESVLAADVLTLAKIYIERYPLTATAEGT